MNDDTEVYCQHGNDPEECFEVCVCGHRCRKHSLGGKCDECYCRGFVDAPLSDELELA